MRSLSRPTGTATALRRTLPARHALAAIAARLLVACSLVRGRSAPNAEPVHLCARGGTVEGVDVSEHQGTVDWAAVRASGRRFAIARLGDGLNRDPTFARNWAAIRANGMVRGAYQYFRPNLDPLAQADIAVDAVGLLGPNDLPVAVDVETAAREPRAAVVASVGRWIARVRAGTGKPPIVYTAAGLWNAATGGASDFGLSPLWVANYGVGCPTLPVGWSAWVLFQYSETGAIPGIRGRVDLDRFNGTLEELTAFALEGAAPRYAATVVRVAIPARIRPGDQAQAVIELRNTGTAGWDNGTFLATTAPRDRASPFASSAWPRPDRPARVTSVVAPGTTFLFAFTLRAPATAARFVEHFGMVHDRATWFGDPGQGGPTDEQIEAVITVSPDLGPRPDAGAAEPIGVAPDATPAADAYAR